MSPINRDSRKEFQPIFAVVADWAKLDAESRRLAWSACFDENGHGLVLVMQCYVAIYNSLMPQKPFLKH